MSTDAGMPKTIEFQAAHIEALKSELSTLRTAYEAAQGEIAALRELVRDANDLLDDARSGYIGGCGADLKWDKKRDEFRDDAARKP